MKRLVTIFILTFAMMSTSYKILGLLPHSGLSHFKAFQPILKGLAEAGHEVTVVSHFPTQNATKNYKDVTIEGLKTLTEAFKLDEFTNTNVIMNVIVEFDFLYQVGRNSCIAALNSTAIAEVLNTKEKYDVILLEQFNIDCMPAVAYKLQTPFIGMSSCALMPWLYDRISNPHIPSYIPALFMEHNEQMSYGQRLGNWLTIHILKFFYRQRNEREANNLIKKYLGDGIPDVSELVKMTSLMLVNQHFTLSGAKPTSTQVIEIGGAHIGKPKTLDNELQHILDSAEHGVIYISWGSRVRSDSLPIEKRDILLKTLAKFPHTILWKFETETIENLPSNMYIRKWWPQLEILCHPNVRVFWGHGGLLGATEAVHCGVPLIVTPFYGDQFLNGASLKFRGAALFVHYNNFTEENLYSTLVEALKPRMGENARKLAYAFNHRPQTPLETAIWWIEHVAATRGEIYTKSYATELPWYKYHSIDVHITLLLGLIATIWFWKVVIYKCCCRKARKNMKIKKT